MTNEKKIYHVQSFCSQCDPRTHYTVEANSEDEALDKAKSGDIECDFVEHTGMDDEWCVDGVDEGDL